MMKYLFIDESGNSNLRKPDLGFPIFVLGGVLVDERELPQFEEKVKNFKKQFFKTSDIILHMSEIGASKNEYAILQNPEKRKEFYQAIENLLSDLEFEFIEAKFDISQAKPNEKDCLAITLEELIENALKKFDEGIIVFESGDKGLDKKIHLAWEGIKLFGTNEFSPQKIDEKIVSFKTSYKSENIIGLQICDLIVSQISRIELGMKAKLSKEIITSKIKGATPATQE